MFLKIILFILTSNLVNELKCSKECVSKYGKPYKIGDMWKGQDEEDEDCYICRCTLDGR